MATVELVTSTWIWEERIKCLIMVQPGGEVRKTKESRLLAVFWGFYFVLTAE